jgi:PAS domain S-box-containing protein
MLDRPGASGYDESIAARLDAVFDRGIESAFFGDVLALLLESLESPGGVFAHVDELDDLVCASIAGTLALNLRVPAYVPRDACQGTWAAALQKLEPRIANQPQRVTVDGPPLERNLAVPIVFGREVIGLLCATDRERAYEPQDQARALWIAKCVAPHLFARSSERRFRRQLAELEEMAKAAVEGERFFMLSGDLMAIVQERIERANPAFWSHLGWDDHELRDRSLPDLAHPADRDAFGRDLERMRSEPNREHPPVVVRMLAKAGNYLSIEWTGTGTDEGRIYAVGRDVSELRSAVARLAAQNEELHVLHEQVRREQRLAAHLLANVRKQGSLDIPGVQHLTSPLDFFNGDVALAANTPDGCLRWMLGDFTGHGLSAAVGTIPVASTFYATCRKGVTVAESIETINDLLKGVLPAGLFCAAAFLSLDPVKGELTVWNGGLPPVIVRNTRDGSLRQHTSEALPLGLVNSRELVVTTSVLHVNELEEIFVYSDGLTEAENSTSELFGKDRIASVLSQPGEPGSGFALLVDELKAYRGAVAAADDVSLVVVTVGALRIPNGEQRATAG